MLLFSFYVHSQSKLALDLSENFQPENIRQISLSVTNYNCINPLDKMEVFQRDSNNQWTSESAIILDTLVLYTFTRQLPRICDQLASMKELDFTDTELDSCRRDIRELRSKRKKKLATGFTFDAQALIDPDRLLYVTDNIRSISDSLLHKALANYSFNNSSQNSFTQITITNYQGKEVIILHQHSRPSSIQSPCFIATDTGSTYCSSLAINRLFQEMLPGFLAQPDRHNLLRSIIQAVYLETAP